MQSFIDATIDRIRKQVGSGRAICGLSGGVDSTVAAALVHRAIGDQLTCIYVDHGLMRENESEEVEQLFRQSLGVKLVVVEVAGKKIENIYDYTYALDALRVGETVRIVVVRDDDRIPLEIIPASRD